MNSNSPHNLKQDDYLPCSFYSGKTYTDNGIYSFEKDGKFYFSFMENGVVILRSEAYTSEAGRNNGIVSILKNKENESQYKVLKQEDGNWVIVLEALNNQEIARSCSFSTEDDARALLPGARAMAREALLQIKSLPIIEDPAIVAPVFTGAIHKNMDKEDDYLLCTEYHGHQVSDELNNVALFTHRNGQYYFVIYNVDGSVKLRSEGFRNSTERDLELNAVLTCVNNSSNYTQIEKAGFEIKILKDVNGKEIGRTCPKKIVAIAAPVQEELPKSGGFKWWWLLPLLLLVMLFLWWNSCNKSDVETMPVADTATVTESTVPAAVDTDGDGIIDTADQCPNVAGIAENAGCPEIILYYKRDEASLNEYDKAELDKVVTFLNNHPKVNVILEGHTSTLGEADYNQKLSEQRANSSVEYLVSKGIDAGRLKAVGFGEQFPIGDNSVEEGRSKSRRTVVKVDK